MSDHVTMKTEEVHKESIEAEYRRNKGFGQAEYALRRVFLDPQDKGFYIGPSASPQQR